MDKAIIGKKIGMTQIFDEAGRVVPVTVIEAGPCTVMQKKTTEKDGYNAIQMGFQNVPERKLTKPELGHQKKAGVTESQSLITLTAKSVDKSRSLDSAINTPPF